jgi:hypothetical protein
MATLSFSSPTGSFSSSSGGGEIRLATNHKEREYYDTLSDIYSIIKTIDLLETAYMRDSCTRAEYEAACSRLLSQFNTAVKLVGPSFNVDQFIAEYRVRCNSHLSHSHSLSLSHSHVSNSLLMRDADEMCCWS